MITYRKTKDGDWVAFGPVSEVKVGAVTVTKKNGSTKTENVKSLGKPFVVNGVKHVYGYLEKSGSSEGYKPRRRGGRYECDECGEYVNPGSRCWETGIVH